MSWYCRAWTRNIDDRVSDFEDGEDCDEVYLNARCDNFSRSGTFYVDAYDSVDDSEIDHDSEAYCNEHDRNATWEADYSVADDLRAAGYFVCEDDDQAYHTLDTFNEHRLDDHEAGEDDVDDVYVRPAPTRVWDNRLGRYREPVTTSHTRWAAQ